MGRPFSHFKSLVFRRRQRTCTPFSISASVKWLPINPVPPVTRAFNDFFPDLKIFHSPSSFPLMWKSEGEILVILYVFFGLSRSVALCRRAPAIFFQGVGIYVASPLNRVTAYDCGKLRQPWISLSLLSMIVSKHTLRLQ